jgi:TusA-related sulfurtransferase
MITLPVVCRKNGYGMFVETKAKLVQILKGSLLKVVYTSHEANEIGIPSDLGAHRINL